MNRAHGRYSNTALAIIGLIVGAACWPASAHAQTSTVLIDETFEDASFSSRGWYDTTGGALSTTEKYSGTRSHQCRFTAGSTVCAGGNVGRRQFAESDSVYVAFYIKHSSNWVGSGRSYHPHMMYFVTNLDSAYVGPAYTYLTTYVEINSGVPMLVLQDGKNIDESRIGQNLVGVTENRAVAGCNGDSDGAGNGSCYVSGSVHWNGKEYRSGTTKYFNDTPGSPYYKGDWHLVEAYFKLNTVTGGVGNRDGILRIWYDGSLVLNRTDAVLRTGARATMRFNQFMVLPYIGDGSPVDQSFWIDDLLVATNRPAVPPVPPSGQSSGLPSAPTNLRIVP